MLLPTFSYSPLTQEVTFTLPTIGLYQLVDVFSNSLLTPPRLGLGVGTALRRDGVYVFIVQQVSLVGDTYTVVDRSESFYHLQVATSLCREASCYTAATCAGDGDFKAVLCERYTRQKAVLAYEGCNMVEANKLLRGGCAC